MEHVRTKVQTENVSRDLYVNFWLVLERHLIGCRYLRLSTFFNFYTNTSGKKIINRKSKKNSSFLYIGLQNWTSIERGTNVFVFFVLMMVVQNVNFTRTANDCKFGIDFFWFCMFLGFQNHFSHWFSTIHSKYSLLKDISSCQT